MSKLKFKLSNYLNEYSIANPDNSYYRIHNDRINISNVCRTNFEKNNYFNFDLKENYFFWYKRGMIDYLRSSSQIVLYNQIKYEGFSITKGGTVANNGNIHGLLFDNNNFFESFYLNPDAFSSLNKVLFNGSLGNTGSHSIHCDLAENFNPYHKLVFKSSNIFYIFQNGVFQLNTETGELKFLILFVLDYTTKNIKCIIREDYKWFLKSITLFKTFSKLIEQLKNISYVVNTIIEFETSIDFSEYVEIKEFNVYSAINSLKYREILTNNTDNLVQSILSESEYAETVRVIDSIGDTAVPNESANIEEQEASLLQ